MSAKTAQCSGRDVLIDEIRSGYKGRVVAANDLDIF
jgi:hypothetical protein